mmetsp:Transcript_130071/g.296569  ORF Transcript_130071/g.296569 Transcript_130071/m.296569 type:complete len:150 (-) Transcript_130071:706-1155(-)
MWEAELDTTTPPHRSMIFSSPGKRDELALCNEEEARMWEAELDLRSKTLRCLNPRCGSDKLSKIVRGYPSPGYDSWAEKMSTSLGWNVAIFVGCYNMWPGADYVCNDCHETVKVKFESYFWENRRMMGILFILGLLTCVWVLFFGAFTQ